MKKLLLILLALPLLATAQEKPVQVPTSEAGNAFTIRIPVKFPENMTVQYAWYRNDTLIEDSHTLLLGESKISYTIPASKAYGSAVYHFTYMLHDDYHEWTRSPRYVVSFQTICPLISSAGTIEDACTGATAGAIEDACTGTATAGTVEDACTGATAGAIEDACTGTATAGAIENVCDGITAGTIF